jgi:thymidylate synthase ThyX
MRTIYALTGIQPEVQAYAMAKYSRSRQSMRQSIGELSAQRAEQFLESFYFAYGHRSIADLAHVAMAIENVSILAAIAVVDQQLWDGQERSTRYQDFARTGYYTPDAIAASPEADVYTAAADALFTEYAALSKELTALLVEHVGRPETMDEGDYKRTLRARAFDVTRALLPLATITSVGQITSARTVERQISELLSSPIAEIRAVAEGLRAACQGTAFDPAASAAEQLRETLDGVYLPQEAQDALAALTKTLERTAAAPTLVKYTAPIAYQIETAREMRQAATELLADIARDLVSPTVTLAPAVTPSVELVATLLHQYDPQQHSYTQILEIVGEWSEAFRQEIVDLSMRHRGPHDDLLRAHQVGAPVQFDCTLDLGAFRDFHRHRRCVQIIPAFSPVHGTDDARTWFAWGLGDGATERAADAGFVARYQAALDRARAAIDTLAPAHPDEAAYLLPMAYRCRALFKMDYAEAAYIIEARTKVGGHFSYRHAAYAMYTALAAREPGFAQHVRAIPPTEIDLLRR